MYIICGIVLSDFMLKWLIIPMIYGICLCIYTKIGKKLIFPLDFFQIWVKI